MSYKYLLARVNGANSRAADASLQIAPCIVRSVGIIRTREISRQRSHYICLNEIRDHSLICKKIVLLRRLKTLARVPPGRRREPPPREMFKDRRRRGGSND